LDRESDPDEGESSGRDDDGADERDRADQDGAAEEAAADAEDRDGDETEDEDDDEDETDEEAEAGEADKAAREKEGEAEDEPIVATQLGTSRYVYSAFLGGGLIAAYILGRAVHGVWANFSNRDFFALRFPAAASVHDDTKLTISMLAAGVVTIVVIIRALRRPSLRDWAYEVAGELVKVKWPTRKEVQNSTVVVIATSAIATAYLFLMDRFWGYVTNLIYKTGS
jgi:preprotein translocase subunit SecE